MGGEQRTLVGCILGAWIQETAPRELDRLSRLESSGAGLSSQAQGRGFELYSDRWAEGGERGQGAINTPACSQMCA